MTSFNHYALGAVADWMHRTIGGITPLEPGYRRVLIAPQLGGGIASAASTLDTPYGQLAVRWSADDAGELKVMDVEVPRRDRVVRRPGYPDREVAAVQHQVTGLW